MKKTVAERFWEKVNRAEGQGPKGDCWEWQASLTPNGYGQFSLLGKPALAHRVAYQLETGTTLTSAVVLRHSCDNPLCVRPSHLAPGTHQDNVADRVAKGRTRHGHVYGLEHPNHKVTPEVVRFIRNATQTQTELAAVLGIHQSTISQIKRGVTWKDVV